VTRASHHAVPLSFVRPTSPVRLTSRNVKLLSVFVDLNADVGESFGSYTFGDDLVLMKAVTSVNVAAGFHAGDPSVLRATLRHARSAGVAIGAHPGFPDLAGFGRRNLHLSPREAEDIVLYQLAAVAGVARTEGCELQHVKPHGALYNMAVRDEVLAGAIARAVAAFDRKLLLIGPPGSELLRAGLDAGLRVAAEAFADRAYKPDGSLVPRTEAGALLTDSALVSNRVLRMVTNHEVDAVDGSTLTMEAETFCIHGDTPGAGRLAAAVRQRLEASGITVRRLVEAGRG
jgi:5-oxoprolinase (ATP-hydrolysing) subunit A